MKETEHGGRISFWHLALLASGILALGGFVLAVSAFDLLNVSPLVPPDRGHVEAPRASAPFLTYESGLLAVDRNGTAEVWEPAGPHARDGVFVLTWTRGNSTLVLRLRVDAPPPQRLVPDADLSLTNSFNATLDGAPLVLREGSYADYLTEERVDRRVSGRFHLVTDSDVLDAKWPLKVKRPPYEGILSIGFFGGAAILAAIGWWRKRRAAR